MIRSEERIMLELSRICRIFWGEPLHTSPENALRGGERSRIQLRADCFEDLLEPADMRRIVAGGDNTCPMLEIGGRLGKPFEAEGRG